MIEEIKKVREQLMAIKDKYRPDRNSPENKAMYKAWDELGLAIRELRSKEDRVSGQLA